MGDAGTKECGREKEGEEAGVRRNSLRLQQGQLRVKSGVRLDQLGEHGSGARPATA